MSCMLQTSLLYHQKTVAWRLKRKITLFIACIRSSHPKAIHPNITLLYLVKNQPLHKHALSGSHFMAGRHKHMVPLSATAVHKSHFGTETGVVCHQITLWGWSQHTHKSINTLSATHVATYWAGRTVRGGGEANPVNWEQLGCWVTLEAGRVVNLLSHLRSCSEGQRVDSLWRGATFGRVVSNLHLLY